MVLFNNVVEILIIPDVNVLPLWILASQKSKCVMTRAARASASVVTHPEHEIFHPLNERMFLFNLIGSVVEPHVVHRTLALSCNDFHDVLSKGLAGGISRIA